VIFGDVLAFAPRLPLGLSRICFRLLYRDRCLRVDIGRDQARYEVVSGEPLEVLHEGTPLSLTPGVPQVCACHVPSDSLRVQPPPGRAPNCQGVGADANDNQPRLPLSR
jgi:alpha,alpha-trehalose phosphorylase